MQAQVVQQLIQDLQERNMQSNFNKLKKWVSMMKMPSYKSLNRLEVMCNLPLKDFLVDNEIEYKIQIEYLFVNSCKIIFG